MSENKGKWIWYPGDFEIYHNLLLHSRREEKGMDFPAFWYIPRPEYNCRFYKEYTLAEDTEVFISIRGNGRLDLDRSRPDEVFPLTSNGETKLTLPAGTHNVCIKLKNIETFPSVCIDGEVPTDESWQVDRNVPIHHAVGCDPVFKRCENPEIFPFEYTDLTPVSAEEYESGILYDYGAESFGPVTLTAEENMGSIAITYGESREEALDYNDAIIRETLSPFSGDLVRPARAFRYLYVKAEKGTPKISAKLEYLPIKDIASFTCDDEKIAPIWEMCARTFHLNSREVYLDGIKRDRWCWSGDAYQSFMVNRYLYFEPSIIRRTIRSLLGKPPYEQHINTINDYSAYLIIAVWEYYFTTGDIKFVNSISNELYALYQFIVSRLNSESGYVERNMGDWIFIDWATIDKEGPICPEQILLWQVYNTMEKLSKISDIPNGDYCQRAEKLKANIMCDYWDDERSGFIDSFTSGKKHISRHSGIFAILYDFVDVDTQNQIFENVLKNDDIDPITTPYFKFYELLALGKMGDILGIEDYIDSYWGGMLDLGATTVWEQFDPRKEGTEHFAMYGNKYGCSLCHAWGAGPIALIGNYLVGVKPTDVAYKTFTVAPSPGRYEHFEAVVPVCGGSVSVKYKDGSAFASATVQGGTLVWNGKMAEIPVGKTVVLD